MQLTPWYQARRHLPSPEGIPPAVSQHTPVPPLRPDGAVSASETYYAYHLGRAVQHHHRRLCAQYHPYEDGNQ